MKTVLRRLKQTVFYKHFEVFLLLVLAVIACFSCFITAKTTYVINDGDETIVVKSAPDDAELALAEAGVTLEEHDSFESIAAEKGNDVNITVFRPHTISFSCRGEAKTVMTLCSTVGEFLEEQNISVEANDRLNYELSDEITDNMNLVVQNIRTVVETVKETVEYDIIYAVDPVRESGYEEIICPGSNGEKAVTYERLIVDGVEKDTYIKNESVLAEPVTAIIACSAEDERITTAEKVITINTGETYDFSKVLYMTATAYTHSGNATATGVMPYVGVVAADTSVLPFGTIVYVTSASGGWTYGYAVVADTGVSGRILDLFMDTYDECIQFGMRDTLVYVIG